MREGWIGSTVAGNRRAVMGVTLGVPDLVFFWMKPSGELIACRYDRDHVVLHSELPDKRVFDYFEGACLSYFEKRYHVQGNPGIQYLWQRNPNPDSTNLPVCVSHSMHTPVA